MILWFLLNSFVIYPGLYSFPPSPVSQFLAPPWYPSFKLFWLCLRTLTLHVKTELCSINICLWLDFYYFYLDFYNSSCRQHTLQYVPLVLISMAHIQGEKINPNIKTWSSHTFLIALTHLELKYPECQRCEILQRCFDSRSPPPNITSNDMFTLAQCYLM